MDLINFGTHGKEEVDFLKKILKLFRNYQTRKYLIRRILNKLTFGYYRKLRGYVSPIVKDEIFYRINTDIGSILYFSGTFENAELNLCRKFIKPDGIIIDIGANIGYHSIFFSKLVPNGLVLSIEPSVDTYNILIRNVKAYENIVPINIAIAEEPATADFYVAEDDAYSSLKDTKRKKIIRRNKVVVFPLDYFMDIFKRVDLIKIDVEGKEKEVIKSSINIIKKYKPVIFVEIYKGEASNDDPEGTIKILLDLGYQAYNLIDGKLHTYTKHNDVYYNYFFIIEGKHELPKI